MASQISIPEFSELVRVFTRIGCLSFGGPAGQIALMHRELVEERKWIDEEQYLHALNFCHLLPGPEAQQLATWIGWRMYGVRGGLAAGLLFVVPGHSSSSRSRSSMPMRPISIGLPRSFWG